MRFRIIPVAADLLPEGVDVVVITGAGGATVVQVSDTLTMPQACAALQDALGGYLSDEWLHVGQIEASTA